MSNPPSETKEPVLTFEGKKYMIKDLPSETKEMIKSLQIADAQIKMHEDTLKLISIGRNTLALKLKEKLNNSNI